MTREVLVFGCALAALAVQGAVMAVMEQWAARWIENPKRPRKHELDLLSHAPHHVRWVVAFVVEKSLDRQEFDEFYIALPGPPGEQMGRRNVTAREFVFDLVHHPHRLRGEPDSPSRPRLRGVPPAVWPILAVLWYYGWSLGRGSILDKFVLVVAFLAALRVHLEDLHRGGP